MKVTREAPGAPIIVLFLDVGSHSHMSVFTLGKPVDLYMYVIYVRSLNNIKLDAQYNVRQKEI